MHDTYVLERINLNQCSNEYLDTYIYHVELLLSYCKVKHHRNTVILKIICIYRVLVPPRQDNGELGG